MCSPRPSSPQNLKGFPMHAKVAETLLIREIRGRLVPMAHTPRGCPVSPVPRMTPMAVCIASSIRSSSEKETILVRHQLLCVVVHGVRTVAFYRLLPYNSR